MMGAMSVRAQVGLFAMARLDQHHDTRPAPSATVAG